MPHLNGWRPEVPGYVASLPPERKLQALLAKPTVTAVATGDVVDWRSGCSPVENQADLGSCVANAIVGDLEFLEISQGMPYVDLSRLFLYYNARLASNEVDKDEGSVISVAMNSLTQVGVCKEETFPYDTNKVFYRPTWEAYREAYAHTLVEYFHIESYGNALIADIQKSLQAKHPVVFGTPVYEAIRSCTGQLAMPSGKSIGGHAMLIVGYDIPQRVLIVRNSWGTGWGDAGYCYVPFDYLSAAGASDFAVGTLYR